MEPAPFRVDQALGLPIVDLAGLGQAAAGNDLARLRLLGAAFDEACRAFGFCYIVNHGVEQGLIDRAFAMSAAFHALPLEEKQRIKINAAHRGYMGMASSLIVTSSIEKAVRPNLSESFMLMHEIAPEDEAHPLDGPNQWPARPAGFREAVGAYDSALQRLSRQMTHMIAVALGLPPEGLDAYFERPTTFLRLLHYPPSPPDAGDKQYGSAPHTDYGFITILAQDQQGGPAGPRSRQSSGSTPRPCAAPSSSISAIWDRAGPMAAGPRRPIGSSTGPAAIATPCPISSTPTPM